MRGASALGELLKEARRDGLTTYVVWVPVLPGDEGPPSAVAAAPLPSRNVRQRWDPERRVAIEAVRALPDDAPPPCRQRTGMDAPDAISWDCAIVFEAGARWEAGLPDASFFAGPVVYEIDEIRQAIDAPAK